jgi:hypothetical protein
MRARRATLTRGMLYNGSDIAFEPKIPISAQAKSISEDRNEGRSQKDHKLRMSFEGVDGFGCYSAQRIRVGMGVQENAL